MSMIQKFSCGCTTEGLDFLGSKFMGDMVVLGAILLIGGVQCFKAYDSKQRELLDAKKKVADLKEDLIRTTYSNRIYRAGEHSAKSALISVRRENNILKQEVAMLTSGSNIVEFTVPSNMGPGMVATIQSEHGLRRQIVLPEGANPGSVHKVDFAVKKGASFTKEEIEDIMNGIFSVREDIDDGRYLSLNNKLKMIHDAL